MAGTQQPLTIEGVIKYPPVLGFARTEAGMIARLANTLDTPDGFTTIVLLGERAEIAEPLLRAGSVVRASGSWDPTDRFEVDRFDVAGSEETHRYQLTDPATTDAAPSQAARPVPLMPAPQRREPPMPPPPPSQQRPQAEPAEYRREARPEPRRPQRRTVPGSRTGDRQDRSSGDGASRAMPFQAGQRVVALDRGNRGTVEVVFADRGEALVHFRAADGAKATRVFPVSDLRADPVGPDPAEAARAPTGPDDGQPAAPARTDDRSRRDQRTSSGPRAEHLAGPVAPQVPHQALDPGRPDREPGQPMARPLRVHTRQPDPQTGAILL